MARSGSIAGSRVEALHIESDGPAAKAGLKNGDTLLKINGAATAKATDVPQILAAVGAWNKADYTANRNGVEFKAAVVRPRRAAGFRRLLSIPGGRRLSADRAIRLLPPGQRP